MEIINGLGRRKTAVARVYLRKGKGNIVINNKDGQIRLNKQVGEEIIDVLNK